MHFGLRPHNKGSIFSESYHIILQYYIETILARMVLNSMYKINSYPAVYKRLRSGFAVLVLITTLPMLQEDREHDRTLSDHPIPTVWVRSGRYREVK